MNASSSESTVMTSSTAASCDTRGVMLSPTGLRSGLDFTGEDNPARGDGSADRCDFDCDNLARLCHSGSGAISPSLSPLLTSITSGGRVTEEVGREEARVAWEARFTTERRIGAGAAYTCTQTKYKGYIGTGSTRIQAHAPHKPCGGEEGASWSLTAVTMTASIPTPPTPATRETIKNRLRLKTYNQALSQNGDHHRLAELTRLMGQQRRYKAKWGGSRQVGSRPPNIEINHH